MVVPIIPTLMRLRHEDCKLEASLGYIAKHVSKKENKTKKTQTFVS
jgi:hypothetical protein